MDVNCVVEEATREIWHESATTKGEAWRKEEATREEEDKSGRQKTRQMTESEGIRRRRTKTGYTRKGNDCICYMLFKSQ